MIMHLIMMSLLYMRMRSVRATLPRVLSKSCLTTTHSSLWLGGCWPAKWEATERAGSWRSQEDSHVRGRRPRALSSRKWAWPTPLMYFIKVNERWEMGGGWVKHNDLTRVIHAQNGSKYITKQTLTWHVECPRCMPPTLSVAHEWMSRWVSRWMTHRMPRRIEYQCLLQRRVSRVIHPVGRRLDPVENIVPGHLWPGWYFTLSNFERTDLHVHGLYVSDTSSSFVIF